MTAHKAHPADAVEAVPSVEVTSAVEVTSFDVVTPDSKHALVVINGIEFRLDPQQMLALRGLLNGAAMNLNY